MSYPRQQPPQWRAPQNWPPPQQQWGPPQQQRPQWGPPQQWGSPQRQAPPGWGPPQWGPNRGAPPPKRSNGLGWFLLLLVGAALAVFLFAGLTRGADPVQPPVPPRSEPPVVTSTEPGEPTLTPGTEVTTEPNAGGVNPGLPPLEWPELPPPDSTDPDWVTLQQSILYDVPVPALTGCPPPERAATLADLERLAAPQADCVQDAWRPVLAQLGLPSHEVPVYFYAGSTVDTQCGRVSAPALYCSYGSGTIYIGESTLNGAAWHDFGVKDMVGHEYTHHLQALAGMFESEYRVNQGNEGARRSELQATCGGYAMIARDDSFQLDRATFDTFEPYLRAVIEDGIHGSRDSVAYWGLRGLYSTDLGNCNTWTAASEDVD